MTELQHSKEFLKEEDSPVVRQPLEIAGDFDISWQIWHVHEMLTESCHFVARRSTEKKPVFPRENDGFGTHFTP
jgi:hypothetical protein